MRVDHVRKNDLPILAGFVHFPASTEMALDSPFQPSLPMEMMVEALKVILETVAVEAQESSARSVTASSASE